MKKRLYGILVLGFLVISSLAVANEVASEADRDIASDRNPAQDRQEGWIVRQTETGLVKVPAKQYFRFEGANISGKAYTPFQAVFDQRPNRRNKSLIPVRTSFKREVLDASGYSGR